MLFWHPSGAPTGAYYFGTQLVDAKDPQWDSVVSWVDALQDKFSNVYVPWTSHQHSMWRVCNLSVTLAEQLKDETEGFEWTGKLDPLREHSFAGATDRGPQAPAENCH